MIDRPHGPADPDKSRWFLVLPLAETPRELLRAPATVAVLVASLAVVALGGPWPAVTRALECTSEALARGELWRLLTYVFPHEGGWQHVLVNMTVLALFGWQLERRIGSGRLLLVYLGSGAVGMALLFAFNPIDATRGLRSGASLAVFGVVAALTTWHAADGGIRGPALPWAIGTCLALLLAGGVLAIGGHEGAVEPGLAGFQFGFWNHALGMVAGVPFGLAVLRSVRTTIRWAAALAVGCMTVGGLVVGAARWTVAAGGVLRWRVTAWLHAEALGRLSRPNSSPTNVSF